MNSTKVSKLFVTYRSEKQKHEFSEELNFDANPTDLGDGNLEEDSAEGFHQEMQKYLNRCIQYHQKLLMYVKLCAAQHTISYSNWPKREECCSVFKERTCNSNGIR